MTIRTKFKMLFYVSWLLCSIIGKTVSGVVEPRIHNGEDAQPGQFPWMVSLQSFSANTDKFSHDCGGTIIDRRHILTAAHCFQKGKCRILVGAHNISQSDSNEPTRKAYEICRFHFHPEFDFQLHSRDILVITLKTPIEYNDYVQPLRLAPADSDPVGQTCVVIGWGFMGNHQKEQNLQVVNVTCISLEECLPWSGQPFVVNEYNVCSRNIGEHQGVPDKGDSGGPLMCYDEKGPYLAGMVSWGPGNGGCVYGGVKAHLEFIKCMKT